MLFNSIGDDFHKPLGIITLPPPFWEALFIASLIDLPTLSNPPSTALKSKILYSDDLYTYDSSYNTIDLTEEKITSAILNVTADKIANVYFLTGYSDYSLDYS